MEFVDSFKICWRLKNVTFLMLILYYICCYRAVDLIMQVSLSRYMSYECGSRRGVPLLDKRTSQMIPNGWKEKFCRILVFFCFLKCLIGDTFMLECEAVVVDLLFANCTFDMVLFSHYYKDWY